MGGKLWLFLLLGCCLLAGCQQTETVSVPPAVGCYPVEGYAPDPADVAAAPYSYTGGAEGISVTCTVRQAEPAAFSALRMGFSSAGSERSSSVKRRRGSLFIPFPQHEGGHHVL